MNSWPVTKLGDIAEVKGGKRLPKGYLIDDNKTLYPYIRVTDMVSGRIDISGIKYISKEVQKTIQRYTISDKDIFISIAGTIGLVGKIPPIFNGANLTENAAKITNIDQEFDRNFILYYLQSVGGQFQIKQRIGGSTQPKLALNRIETIEIPSPSLTTQQNISNLLEFYDNLIENNEKRIKLLEEMAQRLYAEWFVKFKFPGHEKVKMVDSGVDYGKIPEGWKVVNLGEVSKIVRGCSYSTKEIDDHTGEYYLVNLKSFSRGGGFRFDGEKYFSGSINNNQSLKTGDVVVAVTDMTTDRAVIARPARIPELEGKITFSADVVKINSYILPSSFIYQLLSSYRFTETTKQMANGANVLHLKPSAILEFVTVIPDAPLLNTFDVLCEPVAREIDKLLKQNDNLSKTRDLLIPQLVTGKKELKN